MATTTPDRTSTDDAVSTPSVLVVLVVRNGSRWLRECLQSLATQRYPRLGVVATDAASADGSRELLVHALGERRVLDLADDPGIAGAVAAASELPAARSADYFLILHDDTALGPDAVSRLVEAAEGIHGVERVGVVGPKVVDWDDPRVLREVGGSVDAFGHPYNPLQEGERDQGQYDRVLEVLFVSSCVLLVSRDAWERTGRFDERYGGHHDDVDFCWRARVAGFRVIMTPLAQARHRDASARGERSEAHRRRSSRYYAERSGLASMLKDYSVLSLLWLLPLYAVSGLIRLLILALGRRFEDAYDLTAGWGWNLVNLPGTVRRRVRAQSVRAVPDRIVRRFMASAFRLPRWFERAEEIFGEQFLEEEEEEEGEERVAFRRRAASFATAHPVIVTSILAAIVGALAVRQFVGPETLQGGVLAAFPPHPSAFWDELLSGPRTTILGGLQAGSPALAALGSLSWLTFASTSLAQKVLLGSLIPISAMMMYRALARQTGRSGPSVVGAVAYGLSAIAMWSFSEGDVPVLVLLCVLPIAWDRLDGAFADGATTRPWTQIVSLGAAIAVGVAFLPGLLLPVLLILAALLLTGRRRVRGLGLALAGLVVGLALVFPVIPDLARAPGASLSSFVGTTDVWSVLRLAPGDGPGTWIPAAFLPAAALLCFAIVGEEQRRRAWTAALLAAAGLGLAWASAARWLPDALTDQPAYLGLAALSMGALVAYGLATTAHRIGREAFGFRQIAALLLGSVLALGIGAQALTAMLGGWAVHPNGLPPAWPIVASSAPGQFHILWLGRPDPQPFPAPGGVATGLVEAGDASVRFTLTDRNGISALDTGRGEFGPGYAYLTTALRELLAGRTGHVGSLLAPLGVRFIVAREGDLPAAVVGRLEDQLDVYRVPAGGLVMYRNAHQLPEASVIDARAFDRAARSGSLLPVAELPPLHPTPLEPADGGWDGVSEGGTAFVAQQFAGDWRATSAAGSVAPRRAFDWAMTFPVGAGGVSIDYTGGRARVLEMIGLGVLWLAALWITRKPVSR